MGAYGKIYSLGHRAVQEILLDTVVVEEKVDGSQISFGVRDGVLWARSKGAELNLEQPEKMFARAIETIKELATKLTPGWTYRGEYLNKPKHNVLAYTRVPNKHIIIFDIDKGEEDYLVPEYKKIKAEELGLETVPLLYSGVLMDLEPVQKLLTTQSILGGQVVEGVVIKNYHRFGIDKKVLLGKVVREDFKEQHKREWGSGDNESILVRIIKKYKSEARWAKAVQHLREQGQLKEEPSDIGPLLKEIPRDLYEEEKAEILDMLWSWAEPHIRRGVAARLPDWYKARLLDNLKKPEVKQEPEVPSGV